jgi:hypothetical protein
VLGVLLCGYGVVHRSAAGGNVAFQNARTLYDTSCPPCGLPHDFRALAVLLISFFSFFWGGGRLLQVDTFTGERYLHGLCIGVCIFTTRRPAKIV